MRLQKGGRDPIRQKLAQSASSSESVDAVPRSSASAAVADLTSREFVEIGPEVLDRMPLEREPSAATVESYVLTHGASRAWEAINTQLTAPCGALFWIGGAAGAGKTHFLNYVLALSARAGSIGAESARHLTLPVEVSGRASAAEIDRHILESIATALGGDDPAPALWRQLRGAEGFTIAFDRARRQGVKGVTIAIDLGLDQSSAAVNTLSALAEVGRGIKQLRLIVAAAGRGDPPAQALAFNVTPHADEELGVAVGRARRLHDSALRTVDGLYGKLESAWDTRAIYPFHPSAASILRSLYGSSLFDSGATIGRLAKAVREVIEPWYRDRDFERLVMPAALMCSPTVRRTLDTELGEAGRAALKIANAAAVSESLDDRAHDLMQALVDTLVLLHIGGSPAMLPVTEIRERMDRVGLNGVDRMHLTDALIALAESTRGVIVYDARAQSAGFNPRGAGAPQVAAFNSALALLTRFDPSLKAAQELPDLDAKRKRLDTAMATAIEDACRNRQALATSIRESGARLSLDQEQAFDRFIELAEGGAAALIEAGADPQRRASAIAAVAAYEPLATIADSLPRFRAMRNYLAATGLLPGYGEDSPRPDFSGTDAPPESDSCNDHSLNGDDAHRAGNSSGGSRESDSRENAASDLETECQLLIVALNPVARSNGGRNLAAIEDRFQTFKATYVQRYRSGHDRHRSELARIAPVADDARRQLEALRRLNAIAALGAPAGSELGPAIATLERRLAPCDLIEALTPEVTPCCPRCDYLLGTPSPDKELSDLTDRVRRALQAKLAALSHHAVARLIREHDRNHRLEGFLKIVQAAQTDSLVRILDDDLARYLAQLLSENPAATSTAPATSTNRQHHR